MFCFGLCHFSKMTIKASVVKQEGDEHHRGY